GGSHETRGDVRLGVASALGQMGPAAAEVVPHLMELLLDGDESVRRASVTALARIGEAAVLPLSKALRHQNVLLRLQAAKALGEMGKTAQSAVQPLSKALRDEDPEVAVAAAQALGAIGPEASHAIPALTEVFRSSRQGETPLGSAAAEALRKIDPKAAAKLGIR